MGKNKEKKKKKEDLAKNLKDNFEAVAKLRERAKEVQRLLTVENIAVREEQRLAKELTSILQTVERLETNRRKKLHEKV